MPTNTPFMSTVQVLSSNVTLGSFDDIVSRIIEYGHQRTSSYTCCANVHMLVEAYRNPEIKNIVNSADLVTADGMPLTKVIRAYYGIEQERVAGMDLLPALLKKAGEEGVKIFFYGDEDKILNQLTEKIGQEYPRVTIAGTYSPPFRKLSEEEKAGIVSRINDSGAQLLFVALGCPKQETWMHEHRGLIQATMIGVGNAFRTYIGVEMRAPAWMQKYSLEWLYRLVQNPKRLWKRYFVTNTLFLLLVMKKWPKKRLAAS